MSQQRRGSQKEVVKFTHEDWVRSWRVILIFSRRFCDSSPAEALLFYLVRHLFCSQRAHFPLLEARWESDDHSLPFWSRLHCRIMLPKFLSGTFWRARVSFVTWSMGLFPTCPHIKAGTVARHPEWRGITVLLDAASLLQTSGLLLVKFRSWEWSLDTFFIVMFPLSRHVQPFWHTSQCLRRYWMPSKMCRGYSWNGMLLWLFFTILIAKDEMF